MPTPVYILAGQSNANRPGMSLAVAQAAAADGALFIHYAPAGSPLSDTLDRGFGDWSGSTDPGSGELRMDLEERIDALMDPASPTYVPDAYVAGVIWVQGEGDLHNDIVAGTYADNLIELRATMVDRYGEHEWIVSALSQDAWIGRNGSENTQIRWNLVRSQQLSLDELNGFTVVDPDQVATANDVTAAEMFNDDRVHYAPDFQPVLGAALAAELTVQTGNVDLIVGTNEQDTLTMPNHGYVQVFGAAGSDLADFSVLDHGITIRPHVPRFAYAIGTGEHGDYTVGLNWVERIQGTQFADVFYSSETLHNFHAGGGDDVVYGSNWEDTAILEDGDDRAYGGQGDDLLHGDSGQDLLVGGGGNDFLYGGTGHDLVLGGSGHDQMYGGIGNDRVNGGAGHDRLYSGDGSDALRGGDGDDRVYGGNGDDRLDGESGNDRMGGGYGHDIVNGHDGDDRMYGSFGADRMSGGSGADVLFGGRGHDTLAGDHGADHLRGGKGNDLLYGLSGNDRLVGNAGDDRLSGGSGRDVLFGHAGEDYLLGGRNNDRLHGNVGTDRLIGGHGDDQLFGGRGNDHLLGNRGDDQLFGGSGNDRLRDWSGASHLYGGGGRDFLTAGAGADTLFGGSGNDRLGGGRGADIFVFEHGDGQDVIFDFDIGQDTIRLQARGFHSLTLHRDGDATIVSYGEGDTIRLQGVNIADLSSSDFDFF